MTTRIAPSVGANLLGQHSAERNQDATAYVGNLDPQAMNGQYLCNRQITVSYAYKKDTKGERHGTPAERVLASSNLGTQKNRPHTMFASGPPILPGAPQANGAVGAPVPPRPFANAPMPPAPVPAIQPPPMQPNVYPPMQMPPQQAWQGQPMQPGAAGIPQQQMQFRGMPPPPPPQMAPPLNRPPPPPAAMGGGNVWHPPPPPQHFNGGHHAMPHMSMQPPPPPPAPS